MCDVDVAEARLASRTPSSASGGGDDSGSNSSARPDAAGAGASGVGESLKRAAHAAPGARPPVRPDGAVPFLGRFDVRRHPSNPRADELSRDRELTALH